MDSEIRKKCRGRGARIVKAMKVLLFKLGWLKRLFVGAGIWGAGIIWGGDLAPGVRCEAPRLCDVTLRIDYAHCRM